MPSRPGTTTTQPCFLSSLDQPAAGSIFSLSESTSTRESVNAAAAAGARPGRFSRSASLAPLSTTAIASTHRMIEMWNGKVWTEKGESLQIRLRACAHAHAHRSVGTGVGVGNNRTRDPPVWRLFQPLPLLPSPPLGSPHTHQAAQRALCRVRIRVLSFAGRRSIRKGSSSKKEDGLRYRYAQKTKTRKQDTKGKAIEQISNVGR